jgi:hypothetical protein
MSTTPPAPAESPMRLPDIALSELPEGTKDFLIAASAASGKSIDEVMKDVLRDAATDHGFTPGKAA